MSITKDYLQELFEYKNGNLYWKNTKGRVIGGSVAGTKSHRYWQTCIDYKIYRNHKLIWIHHNDTNPEAIDHINGDTFDNRIENLRGCTNSQNQFNRKKNKNNISGIKGVSWSTQKNKWRTRLVIKAKEHHIGFFDNLENAQLAIKIAREELHGAFANHG